jgi:hypothetical protein
MGDRLLAGKRVLLGVTGGKSTQYLDYLVCL